MNSVKLNKQDDVFQNKLLSLPIVKNYKEKTFNNTQSSYDVVLVNGIKITIEVFYLKNPYLHMTDA